MNKLIEPIENFFERIANLQGTLFHIDTALTNYSKGYQQDLQEIKLTIPDFALGTNLIISDITGKSDNGWEINYPTKGQHSVKISEYNKETQQLIIRETAYTLSQAFEAFSTFLKDLLAAFFEDSPESAKKLNVLKYNEDLNVINWKSKVRQFNPGKNNKEIFKLLRKISETFENSETNNNKNINLQYWYKVFAFFRHKTTHSGGCVREDDQDYQKLTPNELKYLKHFFPYTESNNELVFRIERKVGDINIKLLAEYAFLAFKELSIIQDHDWMILKNMKY